MNQTTLGARLRRGAALGLGVALLSGAALAAAAPASAAPAAPAAEHITQADISLAEDGATGWQSYSLNYSTDVPGALSIVGGGSIFNTLATPAAFSDYADAVAAHRITWTTTADSGPSVFDLTLLNPARGDGLTLTSVDPASGTNAPGPDSSWTVNSNNVPGLTAYTPTAWQTVLDAVVADGFSEVTSFGLTAQASYTNSAVAALDVFGTTFTFGGPPAIPLDGVTTTIAGSPIVGQTLSLTTAGWPAGTELTYQWFYSGGNFGDAINGATGTSYTVTGDVLNRAIGVIVTGTLEGFSPTSSSPALTVRVSTVEFPAAPAPVANSSELPAFLAANAPAGVQAQDAAGLPAGSLNAGSSHTATITWQGADSFVDVYAYSTPTLVGTFAVVDGIVQVELTTGLLSQLSAGDHTLVVVGQSSKAVQAYAMNVTAGLAETGIEATLPLAAASLMLLLGAALVVARRRRNAQL